jgi:hypothetical protein
LSILLILAFQEAELLVVRYAVKDDPLMVEYQK